MTTSSHPICWFVVTQVKSDRVVYFTNDKSYQPPMHGDWYYIHQHLAELPDAMTLANCWRWRYRGKDFIDTREDTANDAYSATTLLDANKQALRQMLTDKIYALRKPKAARSTDAERLRELRLTEAYAVISGKVDLQKLALLPTAAAARGITIKIMAERTIAAHASQTELLLSTERQRDEMAVAIEQASTQDELLALRERLMGELAPHDNDAYAIKPNHMTPQSLVAEPTVQELEQEQLRLRIQLRLKINNLRRVYVSDYLLDDVVMKYKAQLAQSVVSKKMNGLNLRPLISLAAAQRSTLDDAAHSVLKEMDQTAAALLETEQMKEALLVRIASVKSFQDIDATSKNIDALRISDLKKESA